MGFLVLACHSPVLDGFNGHFQASVHFTLGSAINEYKQHQKIPKKKISGMLGIEPRAAGWEAQMRPLSYAAPSPSP